MDDCPSCGEKMKKDAEVCPKCGLDPGSQTITDLPKAKIRRRKKILPTVPKKDRDEVCVNCRTKIPGNINICPKCGLSPGSQTITDLPPWKE